MNLGHHPELNLLSRKFRNELVVVFTWLLLFCAERPVARAALQFDVFLGYDGIVSEASWFPVVCEIKNDGPSFTGTVELTGGSDNAGQTRRLTVELPTGTLKRVVLPAFAAGRSYRSTWEVSLLDERGKVRAEQAAPPIRKQLACGTPLMGALSRTAGGTPAIRPLQANQPELQPAAARLLPSLFPDNPLVLEALDSLYLNSERAADLSVSQVAALFAWLNAGGHLILAVEQPADVTASPWLKGLCPCDLKELQTVARHPELQNWLRSATWSKKLAYLAGAQRNQYGRMRAEELSEGAVSGPFSELPNDFAFEAAALQVATGQVREGKVVVAAGDTPLIITAMRGRGRVTVLLFSPEREPARSWKNLPVFWAKLAEVPGAWYVTSQLNPWGGVSSDGIFGAMIDTRQVHKLPVSWLLLLLLVYLVVIGPLDQYWLKRIGRPMLTWITFPCYVVLFSLVIYFIGYKLRAGESEWNDLHVVDVLAKGEGAELRGRTYSSVYSPVNQRYRLEGQQKCATLRGEFSLYGGGQQGSEKATIEQAGDGFKAEIFVPVWLPELFVSDWWQPAPRPLAATVRAQGGGWQVQVDNLTPCRLTNVLVAVEGRLAGLGELAANETKTFTVMREQGMPLKDFLAAHGGGFRGAVESRRNALGSTERGQLNDLPNGAVAASFLSQLEQEQGYDRNFISPPGLDVSPVVEHGGAVVLAWAADYSPVKPMYQFAPRRAHRYTLWRVAVPVQ